MKKTFFTLVLCLSLFIVKGQDFFFGANIGFHNPIYNIHDEFYQKFQKNYIVRPNYGFVFRTLFKNNLELSAGFSFYTISQDYTIHAFTESNSYQSLRINKVGHYQAYSIPISIGYNLNICRGLAVKFNTGIDFDYYAPDASTTLTGKYSELLNVEDLPHGTIALNSDNLWYISSWHDEHSYAHKFNVLLNSSVSLYYTTKFNMYIGIYAAYHSGLRQIWNNQAMFVNDQQNQSSQVYTYSNGSYLNFGVEIGYRLRGKQCEKLVH